MSEQNTPHTQLTTLLLTPQFKALSPGQTGRLSIINRGAQTELVTLRAEAPANIVSLTFYEPSVTIPPGQQVEVEVRVNRAGYLVHPGGKAFTVPVRADTTTANTAVTDITIELRPRYEWLSPLLLLLCAATTFFALPALFSSATQPTPTYTPTHVPTLTPMPSVTPSLTFTPSPTSTSSPTITPTLSPTPCDSFQCHCEAQGGFVFTVRPGDSWGYIFTSLNPSTDPRILDSALASGVDIKNPIFPKQELCLIGISIPEIPPPNTQQKNQTHTGTLSAAITIDGGITPVCGQPFNVTVILTNTGRAALTGGALNFRDLHPASGNERSNMSAQFPALNPGQSQPIPFTGIMTDIYYNEEHKLQAIVDGQVIGELSYTLQQGNCNPAPLLVPPIAMFNAVINQQPPNCVSSWVATSSSQFYSSLKWQIQYIQPNGQLFNEEVIEGQVTTITDQLNSIRHYYTLRIILTASGQGGSNSTSQDYYMVGDGCPAVAQ